MAATPDKILIFSFTQNNYVILSLIAALLVNFWRLFVYV